VKNKNSNNQGPKLSENSREDDATSHFSWVNEPVYFFVRILNPGRLNWL